MSASVLAEEPRLDFDQLWNFQKPAETERKFRELLAHSTQKDDSYVLQLKTQIARTLSLQEKFKEANDLLNELLPRIRKEHRVAKVRYLLELGRTQNAEKKNELAKKTFQEAFKAADESGEWGYAVDALHMIAITHSYGKLQSPKEKLSWEAKAVAYAEGKESVHAKKWLGSLYFNSGWSYFELKQYQEALETFTKAYQYDLEKGSPDWILLDDRRTIAQMKRWVGKLDEALSELLVLEKENVAKLGEPDGFVFEELGEIYLLKKETQKAKEAFRKAYPILKNKLTEEKDQARLARIKKLGEGN